MKSATHQHKEWRIVPTGGVFKVYDPEGRYRVPRPSMAAAQEYIAEHTGHRPPAAAVEETIARPVEVGQR